MPPTASAEFGMSKSSERGVRRTWMFSANAPLIVAAGAIAIPVSRVNSGFLLWVLVRIILYISQ